MTSILTLIMEMYTSGMVILGHLPEILMARKVLKVRLDKKALRAIPVRKVLMASKVRKVR